MQKSMELKFAEIYYFQKLQFWVIELNIENAYILNKCVPL